MIAFRAEFLGFDVFVCSTIYGGVVTLEHGFLGCVGAVNSNPWTNRGKISIFVIQKIIIKRQSIWAYKLGFIDT